MGCSCGSTKDKDGKVAGCKNNGACGTGGCNKMNVFDWLSNMDMPSVDKFDIAEIRFKNGRKEFYRNAEKLSLHTGDAVIVEVPNGHHLGHVSMQGELVRLQMQKKKVANDGEIKRSTAWLIKRILRNSKKSRSARCRHFIGRVRSSGISNLK